VIQYEPPEDSENYIHRAGRTGRAGAAGIAITLVSRGDQAVLERAVKQYSLPILERTLPTEQEVQGVVSERLTALLEARLRDRDKLQAERSLRFVPLARSLLENEEELPIIAMLLDDYYQQLLHAPVRSPASTQPPAHAPSVQTKDEPTAPRRRRR